LQCLEAAARERERKDGRKGRKSLVLFVCLLFVFVGVRIWFSNGDVCYFEAEEWFHEPGTILKEKTVQEQKEFGAGKRKVGRTWEIRRDSPPPPPSHGSSRQSEEVMSFYFAWKKKKKVCEEV